MKRIAEVARGWAALSEEERAERTDLARALWSTIDGVRPWSELSDNERLFAAKTVLMVRREQRPEYKCAVCLDHLFVSHTVKILDRVIGDVARYCESCDRAIRSEAGFWASKLRPAHGSKAPQTEVLSSYRLRLRVHSRGHDLQHDVDALMSKPIDPQEGT